jgi:multisubunit Na+/H+ antiporter MnhE subunit
VGVRVRFWLTGWVVFCLLWLLLVDTVVWVEWIAAVVAGAVGATVLALLHHQELLRFRPRLRWLRYARRLPLDILADTLVVSRSLVRSLLGHPSDGVLREVPFLEPAGDDPRRGARRALAIAGVSVAPNTFVIAIDDDTGTMLVHQLVRRDPVLATER